MLSKVPSGCIRLTHAVEHGPVLPVDVDTEQIVARNQRRMNVVDQDWYQKHIVIGHNVSSAGRAGRQFAELADCALRVPRAVAADGVREFFPQGGIAGGKTR